MKKNNIRKAAQVALLALPIMMLPGCGALDWIKGKLGMSKPQTTSGISDFGMSDDMDVNGEKKTDNGLGGADDGSEVLVWIEGKPAITMQMLQDELDLLAAERPEFKTVSPAMMLDIKRSLLMVMLNQLVAEQWAQQKGIYDRPEFKKKLEFMNKKVRGAVVGQYFNEEHPMQVTDVDLRAFYDKHKDKLQGKEFSEVKDMLKLAVEQEKMPVHLDDLINKYKDKFGIQVNEDAFKAEEGAMPAGFPAGMQEMSESELEEVSTPQAA